MTPITRHRLVQGEVAAGYEQVLDAFERHARDLGSGGGAFAAYVGDTLVVDLWAGSMRPGRAWERDTISIMMSATKAMATLCLQLLVDRGRVDVEAPVATYWPEFAAAGKAGVTVRHVLTHTSGVIGFSDLRDVPTTDGRGWDDYDAIAAGLAASTPSWEPGTRFGYHAMSYGWLVGEIVRRVTGEHIGGFFAREVASPLGLDTHIGTPIEEHHRVARLTGSLTDGLPLPVRLIAGKLQQRLRDPASLNGIAYLARDGKSIIDDPAGFFANPRVLAAEIPAGNGTTTARSLARVYACLGAGGELDSVRLLSPETVALFAAEATREPDALMDDFKLPLVRRLLARPVVRSLGYLINPAMPGQPSRFGPNPRSYGHDGAGGQIGFCDPDGGVAIGFVRSSLTSSPALSNRLIAAVYTAAARA